MGVNSIFSFCDIQVVELEAILRGSCVIKFASWFFDALYLKKHFPDHEAHGIFARRPRLTNAFRTMPYAAAWNRMQHVFEEEYG